MTEVYRNAFTEVYEIINYLDDEEYNKIPKEVIQGIEENRNQEYEYFLDETIPFYEQEMLPETKAILFNFFRDYLSTKEQKEKIVNVQRLQRTKKEEEKRENYQKDIFRKNTINNEVEKTALIKTEENKFHLKLFEFFKTVFNKLKRK